MVKDTGTPRNAIPWTHHLYDMTRCPVDTKRGVKDEHTLIKWYL